MWLEAAQSLQQARVPIIAANTSDDADLRVQPTHTNAEPAPQLNTEQRRAVDVQDKPKVACIIVAGAGSGKTRTLVYRACHLAFEKSVSPGNILVLAYTKKAAKDVQARVEAVFTKRYQQNPTTAPTSMLVPTVKTFHALAFRLIGIYHRALGFETFSSPLSDAHGCRFVEDAIDLQNWNVRRLKWCILWAQETGWHRPSAPVESAGADEQIGLAAWGALIKSWSAAFPHEYEKMLDSACAAVEGELRKVKEAEMAKAAKEERKEGGKKAKEQERASAKQIREAERAEVKEAKVLERLAKKRKVSAAELKGMQACMARAFGIKKKTDAESAESTSQTVPEASEGEGYRLGHDQPLADASNNTAMDDGESGMTSQDDTLEGRMVQQELRKRVYIYMNEKYNPIASSKAKSKDKSKKEGVLVVQDDFEEQDT